MSAASEVLVRRLQNMQTLILNRPAKLNSLNRNMVNIMASKLQVFEDSPVTKSILLTSGENSRAFCAGGDIKALLKGNSGNPDDVAEAVGFMQNEYQLNHHIGTHKKPIIALMNGITMGGGVGLSVHAPFRIATENTILSMPETAIGLFPDVGGSFFLPRLDGELGTYLGLTGHRLVGMEVFMAGIATHFVPSERLPALLERLAGLETEELETVNAAIEEYVAEPPVADDWNKWSLGGDVAAAINRCFSRDSLGEIVEALEAEQSAWASDTLNTLKQMSPTSLIVTLAQLRRGRQEDFESCFRMEYRMVQDVLQGKDFREGVTSVLINKAQTPPSWSPSWDEALTSPALSPLALESQYFEKRLTFPPPLAKIQPRLSLANSLTYFDYPHRTLSGLPTDRDVQRVLNISKSRAEALDMIVRNWGTYANEMIGHESKYLPKVPSLSEGNRTPKIGLVEKVESILARVTDKSKL
ncbi:ClpP/crotonase-like domain-containing protein [Obelidium mucronatum]|nr:ClpP/crotonase-like domain-containing protein [Obelidium mucronatum]